jgi:hypothetical protein
MSKTAMMGRSWVSTCPAVSESKTNKTAADQRLIGSLLFSSHTHSGFEALLISNPVRAQ